jgi:hypothetical protein
MAITLIVLSGAIIGGVWIMREHTAHKRQVQAANGQRLANVIRS